MDRGSILGLSAIIALATSPSLAQQKTIKEQIAGTWLFASAVDVHPDGRRVDPWGQSGKGMFIFDGNGRYTQFIVRTDLPKIAGGTRDKGTPDENKAVMGGIVGSFGTYTVDEGSKTVTTKVEGGTFPNLFGVEQKRLILSLTADELKYANPTTSTGMRAESIWRRAK